MYVLHLLIHASVDGHLGCFHVMAVVSNATLGCFSHPTLHRTGLQANYPFQNINRAKFKKHYSRKLESVKEAIIEIMYDI